MVRWGVWALQFRLPTHHVMACPPVTRAETAPAHRLSGNSQAVGAVGAGVREQDTPAEGKGCRAGRDPSLNSWSLQQSVSVNQGGELVAGDCGHRPDLATDGTGAQASAVPNQGLLLLLPAKLGECPFYTWRTMPNP